jgi:RHS repeat-associated protein
LPAVGVPSHILDLPFTTHAAHARGFALSGARARVILVCAVALALMTTLGRAPIAHALSVHLNLAVVKAHLPHSRAGREAPEHEFGGGRPPAAPQARGWARGGNHGTILQYSYDAFGRRVHKQKRTPDGHLSNNNFLWDGEVLAADLDDQRGPRVFVHEPGTFLPVLQQQDGEVFLSVNDHLGMPKDLVSADGLVAWSAQHSAYGKVVAVDADDAAKARYGEGGPSSPFRLLGQVADEDAEICWTRFRCFDAESGRWLTPDPIGIVGGPNLSGFDGPPTRNVDPQGLSSPHSDNRQFESRSEAKDAAYARAGISPGTAPDAAWEVGNDSKRRGEQGYLYTEDTGAHGNYEQFETERGSRVIAEHTNDGQGHFHAGQPKADPSRDAVDFGWGGKAQEAERYQQVDGRHHYYYPP